jgi:hypothetical protein
MRILFHADLSHGQAAAVWRCRDLLQTQYGIELEAFDPAGDQVPRHADFYLVHSTREEWPEYLHKFPIVVLERIDGAQLSAPVRVNLGHPNLKAVIKNTVYADWNTYNENPWRRHEAWCRGYEPTALPPSQRITPDQYAKLKLGFSFTAYPHYDAIRSLEPYELSHERPYVAHFAGTTDYGPEMGWLNWHRMQAVAAIQDAKLPAEILADKRTMDFTDYFRTMRESEFVVSPWGLGEPCYRDFEAVLSGCLVIKPDTRHILTVPQQFYSIPQIERYICKPDFSDLREIIVRAEKVSIGDRIQWARYVAEANSTPAITRRLAQIFKDALK